MRCIRLLLTVAVVFPGAGCITSTYKPTRFYALEPVVQVAAVETVPKVLGVRPLEPAQPYTKRQMVYRAEDRVLGFQQYDEWSELPGDTVTRTLMDALVATKRFADVGNASDVGASDLILTGQLRKFDEVRSGDPWAAECEIRLELREGLARTLVWANTLSVRKPLGKRSPAGFAAAMNDAVSEMAQEAAEQIAAQFQR